MFGGSVGFMTYIDKLSHCYVSEIRDMARAEECHVYMNFNDKLAILRKWVRCNHFYLINTL